MHTFTFGQKYLITNKKTKKSLWFIYDGVVGISDAAYLGEPIHMFRHQSPITTNEQNINNYKILMKDLYLVANVSTINIGQIKLINVFAVMPESIANEYTFKNVGTSNRYKTRTSTKKRISSRRNH